MNHRIYYPLLFAFLLVMVVTGSFFCLTGKPAVWFDEGIFLHVGRTLAEEGEFGMQLAPGTLGDLSVITVGYPFLMPLAFMIKTFGASIFVARFMMGVFIVGLVLGLFFLARRMYGTNIAFLSAFLLVSFAPLYGNGKSAIGEIPGLFFLVWGLWLLHQIEADDREAGIISSRRRYGRAVLGGLMLGLAASTKPIFLVIVPALIIAVIGRFRFWQRHGYELMSGGVGFIVALVIWVITQFGGLLSLTDILVFYSNPYVVSAGTIIGFVQTNVVRFVTESTPLHFTGLFLTAVTFFIIKVRRREMVMSTEIAVSIFIILVLFAYLRTPGWYRYFFPAHVMLFLFFPAACLYLGVKIKPFLRTACYLFLIILFIIQLGHFIMKEHSCAADSTILAKAYLNTIPAQKHVLFYNSSELAFLHHNKNFSQYLRINEGLQVGEKALPELAEGFYDVVAIPDAYLSSVMMPACYELTYKAGHYIFFIKNQPACTVEVNF